jgi:hypothetical protein
MLRQLVHNIVTTVCLMAILQALKSSILCFHLFLRLTLKQSIPSADDSSEYNTSHYAILSSLLLGLLSFRAKVSPGFS